MSEAGKIGPKKQQPWLTSPRRDQTEAAWAADYRLSPVAQVTLDRNGCIRRINVAAAVLLKAEPSQLTDIPLIAFVDKAYGRLFLDHVTQTISGSKKVCTRLALSSTTRANGPVELQSMSAIDRVSGRVFCRTAILTLSSAKRAGAAGLWSDQSGHQEWFELFPDAAIIEVGGRIVSANPGALRRLGASSSDEVNGRAIMEIVHPDSRQRLGEQLSREPKGKSEPLAVEETFVRLDGSEIAVNLLLKSVDLNGVFATLIVAHDLSKERQMEESLVWANELSEQVLANNSIATAMISVETGRFSEANEFFTQLVGRSREQIAGQSLSLIRMTGADGKQSDLLSLPLRVESRDCEATLIRPDGTVLEVLASAKAVLSGSERSVLLMIQDLTDLRRLRQDIITIVEEEQRRFGRDLHDSHCQDLTAIAFFAETIAAGLAENDKEAAAQIRRLVGMVQKSAENVHALAAGLDSRQIEESGLAAALEELASRVGRRFGILCTANVDGKFDHYSSAQGVHLYRIAQEAMSNAARHSHAGTVAMELRVAGDTGILRIRDDGAGFSAENKSNGLGLRTMQYRASVIKGTLQINSKPGSGTVITCSFPMT